MGRGEWIAVGLAVWVVSTLIVGPLFGRIIRERGSVRL